MGKNAAFLTFFSLTFPPFGIILICEQISTDRGQAAASMIGATEPALFPSFLRCFDILERRDPPLIFRDLYSVYGSLYRKGHPMDKQNAKQIFLAPSLLAANFAKLGEQLAEIRRGGATYLHLDVMDGLFVPNLSFGVPVIQSLRPCSDLIFDVHLMIDRPERYISDYVAAGAEILTFHYEATADPRAVLEQIRAAGVKAAISVKPGTPVEALYDLLPLCDMVLIMTVEPGFGGQKFREEQLEKVRKLVAQREAQGLSFLIEADGGIGEGNARLCAEAGVDILVAGSSVLGKADPCAAARAVLSAAEGRS